MQKEKIAGRLEEVVCRCRTAKAEETYAEFSICSDAGNYFSWLLASCTGFSKQPVTSFREYEFKFPVCVIRCGFKGGFKLGNNGLKNVSSNVSNDNSVIERTEKTSNVLKSLVGEMADMKNEFEYVAFT